MNDIIIIKLNELITYYQNIKFSNTSARLISKSQEMSTWLRKIKQEYISGSQFLNLVKEKEQLNILSGIVLSSLDKLFPINWNKYGVPSDYQDLLIDPNQGNFELNNYLKLDYLKNFFEILKEIYQEQDLEKCLLNIEHTRGIPDPNTVRKHSYIAFSLKNLKANIMILESFLYGNVIYLVFGDKKREWYLGKTKEELNSLPNVHRFEHKDDYSLKIVEQIQDYLANAELINSKSDQLEEDENPIQNSNLESEDINSLIAQERYLNLVFILDQLGHVDEDGNLKNVIYSVEKATLRKQKYFMVSLLGYSKSVIIMEGLYTHNYDNKLYIIEGDKIRDIKDEESRRIYLLNLPIKSLHNLSYNQGIVRHKPYTSIVIAKIHEILGKESPIILDHENQYHFCLINPNNYDDIFIKYKYILTEVDFYLKEVLYFMQKNYKVPSTTSNDVNEEKMGKHLHYFIMGDSFGSKIFKLNQDLIYWRERIKNFNILSDQYIWEKLKTFIQVNAKRPPLNYKIENFKGETIDLERKCARCFSKKNYPNATKEQVEFFECFWKREIIEKYLQVWNLIWYMKFHKQIPPDYIMYIDEKLVKKLNVETIF